MASTIGTFGSFTIARLGIYASQTGLNVTGNNISNINTAGYTRQALDQVSFKPGGSDRYASQYDLHSGNGALVTGISQLRDPYLDIRYRTEMSSVGAMDTKLAGLEDIASILDEVGDGENNGDGILEAQLSDLLASLQNLSINTGQVEADAQVRSSAAALCTLLNTYAKDLQEVEQNTITQLKQDVDVVNELLQNIRDLNSAIRKSEIHGDPALEMRDDRNVLIDKLSQYMKIDVIYTEEDIGAGHMVEKLTIKLGNANPQDGVNNNSDTATLIDGVYATQLEVDYDDNYNVTLDQLKDIKDRVLVDRNGNVSQKVALHDNDLYGSLQAIRETLTEAGEFATAEQIAGDPKAASKRGLPYYMQSLDLLANKIAEVFNSANGGSRQDIYKTYTDANGVERYETVSGCSLPYTTYEYEDDNGIKHTIIADYVLEPDNYPEGFDPNNNADHQAILDRITAEQDLHLSLDGLGHGYPTTDGEGGNLFSNSGDSDSGEGITAANISVSYSWAKGDIRIVNSYEEDATGVVPSTANDNILHLITMMNTKFDFSPGRLTDSYSDEVMFTGTFQEMFANIGSVLGNDMRSTTVMLETYYAASVELDSSREGVSGVDLNDEAMNLMQYQKSYSAACRLLTTLDEALEKLINGTGVVGR